MAKVFMCPVCANTGAVSVFKDIPICRHCKCKQIRLKGFFYNADWMDNPYSKKLNRQQYQKYYKEVIEPMGQLDRTSLEFRKNYSFIFQVPVEYTPEEKEANRRDAERLVTLAVEHAKREEATRPRCPTCTSANIRKIGTAERGVSAVALGVMSNKVGKTFQCNHCGYTW